MAAEPDQAERDEPSAEQEPYRDDVRRPLVAHGWQENEEGALVAPNGASWTEVSDCLDSGVDSPDHAWSIPFDSGVPAEPIVAAVLAAGGIDVPALLTEMQKLRDRVAELTEQRDDLLADDARAEQERNEQPDSAQALRWENSELRDAVRSARAKALSEAKAETVAWLAKKAAEQRALGGKQHAAEADVIDKLADKASRGAVRLFLEATNEAATATCSAALLPQGSAPAEPCVVTGPHKDHRTAAGETWTDDDLEPFD
ncbi:hypothetical protein [Streptomyces nanshensis]|uniref:Uncharacterized protein n=1 Tax=Streptomyces nanshensis TaxID=518642 RepID=A0A1E7LD87_9ACTN|nr:hypothetical protein [Streptomyces nanshensis]OEV14071.1 hypothetical protein AN218_00940 [Streptomyces nanshensis]